MSNDSNSVNIDSDQNPYHHGNLREALVSAGLAVLASKNSDAFSMREVARNAGVSATSVYRHFPNKETFKDALCAEGSQMLASVLRKAMTSVGGHEGFDASGLAYVHFALANPTLFRLMSKSRPTDEGFGGAKNPAMQELLANVAALLPSDVSAQQRDIRAFHAWSIVHGVTSLVLEGRIPNDDELILAVLRTPET